MSKEQTATFIGHNECYNLNKDIVRKEIVRLIENGVTDFLNGGMGSFDRICAKIVFELKDTYPHIRNYLVIPYLTFEVFNEKYFDSILYPDGFEKYHFKSAILARNKYLVAHSAYAICYITHGWGGAAQTYEKAIKQGLTIINTGENT